MAAPAHERVVLRDGLSVFIRRAIPADEADLHEFLGALCLEARRFRFFTAGVNLDAAAHWAATSSNDRLGLVVHNQGGTLVGHAAFIELDAKRAEVAVVVADRLHGDGLGTILIERLAEIAEAQGVTQFVAEVLPENRAMIEVFCDGFDANVCLREGVDTVEFPTATWRVARERFDCALVPTACARGVEPRRDTLRRAAAKRA
ncbi:MAG: CoA-binding domain protein [Solirubrobacterales bacterium]|nr:CoA-binding domain protein [Solirubrobacterales bacterium]